MQDGEVGREGQSIAMAWTQGGEKGVEGERERRSVAAMCRCVMMGGSRSCQIISKRGCPQASTRERVLFIGTRFSNLYLLCKVTAVHVSAGLDANKVVCPARISKKRGAVTAVPPRKRVAW